MSGDMFIVIVAGVPLTVLVCAALLEFTDILEPAKYRKALHEAKRCNRYQTMTFRLIKDIYPFLEESFYWGNTAPLYKERIGHDRLLWFREKSQVCLVDISWFDLWRFRRWLKKRKKMGEDLTVTRNECNIILQCAQETIEHEVDRNNQMMRQAIATQQQALQRLTPFEEDYIKSQVNVEV